MGGGCLTTYFDPLPNNQAHALITGFSMEDEIMPRLLAECSKKVTLKI